MLLYLMKELTAPNRTDQVIVGCISFWFQFHYCIQIGTTWDSKTPNAWDPYTWILDFSSLSGPSRE
jgi:hypothetical protein